MNDPDAPKQILGPNGFAPQPEEVRKADAQGRMAPLPSEQTTASRIMGLQRSADEEMARICAMQKRQIVQLIANMDQMRAGVDAVHQLNTRMMDERKQLVAALAAHGEVWIDATAVEFFADSPVGLTHDERWASDAKIVEAQNLSEDDRNALRMMDLGVHEVDGVKVNRTRFLVVK